jgi:hypothetical protein
MSQWGCIQIYRQNNYGNVSKCWLETCLMHLKLYLKLKLVQNFHLNLILFYIGSQNSTFHIATGYGLDGREVGSSGPGRIKHFHFFMSYRPALGRTQPPIQWLLVAFSHAVKQPERENDLSHPTSIQIKKPGSIHSLPIRSHVIALKCLTIRVTLTYFAVLCRIY